MATEVNKYRCYCNTESDYVFVWGTVEPSTCPNNNTHTINTALTTIVETVSTTTIKASEDSDGYFETGHIVMNIPSGAPGDVTEHDVTWPMDVILWRTLITPTTDMIGDEVSVLASPETIVGVITAPVSIGDTVLTVNSTVTDNVERGFLITLYDGVNKNVSGRCTAVDKIGGTITVQTPTTDSFAPGTPVKISIYTLNGVHFIDTNTIDIGLKGMKGKMITSGLILRVYYTNNSATAKTLLWRYEAYARG
jgi:hypothetical protein